MGHGPQQSEDRTSATESNAVTITKGKAVMLDGTAGIISDLKLVEQKQ